MLFDTHAHYDDEQFDNDRKELLEQIREGGVEAVVNVSAAVNSWQAVMDLTEKYSFIYGALGVHPDEVGDLNEENFTELTGLFRQDKIVAVGEIGLDYYWDKESRQIQQKWFQRQLELAGKLQLPVIIHSREAAADTFRMIADHAPDLEGIIHCFSYSRELAREYVKMGYLIGVGGVVTFKNAKKLKEVVEDTPLEYIVLETDCPYLAPIPYRGKRNSSLNLRYVAEEIAAIKGISYEEVVSQTTKNARRIYRL